MGLHIVIYTFQAVNAHDVKSYLNTYSGKSQAARRTHGRT